MKVNIQQIPSYYPVDIDVTPDIRAKLSYPEYLIDNNINKAVRVEIVSPEVHPWIDDGPMVLFVEGRERPYKYSSYAEFIKEWSIPPFDFACPEDEQMINDLYS